MASAIESMLNLTSRCCTCFAITSISPEPSMAAEKGNAAPVPYLWTGSQPGRASRPASAVSGKQVLTIEGLADAGRLHPVQESFIACDAMQCGYCTPGMILSSVALLRKTPSPSDGEIKQALEGNICRCGTYNRIVSAVRQASQSMKTASREGDHA